MIVAVAGSRSASDADYPLLCENMPAGTSEIITGGAEGADMLAARYAHENGIKLRELRPDYKRYGRAAPLRRNERIAELCDIVLAFWDMRSAGTGHIIGHCLETGVPVYVIALGEREENRA